MTYLKSTLAGLAALVVVFGVLPISVSLARLLYTIAKYSDNFALGYGIGTSLRWHPVSPSAWLYELAVFFAGFAWTFRRLKKTRKYSPGA